MSYFKVEVSYYRDGRCNYVSSTALKCGHVKLCVDNLVRMFGIVPDEKPTYRVYAFVEEGEVQI